MSRDSIIFLIDYYRPFEVGGAERSTAALAEALSDAGIGVSIVTPNYGAARRELIRRVEVLRLPFPQKLEAGELARRRWSGNILLQLWYGVMVAVLAWRRRVPRLHVQNSPMIIAGAIASLLSRRPMFATIRDLAYLPGVKAANEHPRGQRLKHLIDGYYVRLEYRLRLMALRRATRIVFVSRGLLAIHADSAPAWVTARSRVVYNIGPAPAPKDAEAAPATVLFVGKLSTGKGLHVLYEAIPAILREVPDVEFEFVGQPGIGWTPPPHDVARNIHLRGRLDEPAVAELMCRSTVLVSPSVWPEPLSRVLLESMSRGLPIVATAVGGTTEALDADTAEIVPAGSAEALATAVLRLLREPERRRALAQSALKRYKTLFTAEQIVPQMLHVYRSTV
jgi:glycosyltransferase involved in cell wall biosynthesis